MFKYFCNGCGKRFESELPERNKLGLLNYISCPRCGAWETYPDTVEGSKQSVKDTLEYLIEIGDLTNWG